MKIVECKKAENCLEGEFIYRYYFDTNWTKETIEIMEAFGALRYYESFPKPMFQVRCINGTVIKGLQDEKECQTILPRRDPEIAKESFETWFQKALSGRDDNC